MPILHCARSDDARAVRADEARLRALEIALRREHVADRNAFGDADDERNARIRRFANRVGRARRRNENHRRVGAGFLHGFFDRVENRNPS